MATHLATAAWADPALVEETYRYHDGDVWLGRSGSDDQLPIGYHDDRHVCLVSGSRAGKGTSSIINNLCLWPGSVVVVDPKGENATVTAPRRGRGSANCEGMGQAVHILDPFKAAQVDDSYRSRFNPLDALDPDNEESVDEAGRIADAIVVMHEDNKDPFWDESARAMVKGLILHVVTDPAYEGRRNLVTLRKLIMRGDWESVEALRASGEQDIGPAQGLLWMQVARNPAFGGLVAGIGDMFSNMLLSSPKQFESVLQVANRNTEFIDSPAMQRLLESSDFELSELKTRREGMSLYLCLPQRFMNTHYRWLRMMIALTVTEMEIVRARPATGFPVLMLLDEFAGLRRMEVIEHAVAQIAGYGVKLFFVLQTLEQLKAVYKDNWETFLSNSGLKVFFSLDDHFSREYVSKLVGETELIREVRSASESLSESESESASSSRSRSESEGESSSFGRSVSEGTNRSVSRSRTHGVNRSRTTGGTASRSSTSGSSWSPAGGGSSDSRTKGESWSVSNTQGTSDSWSKSESEGSSRGSSESWTRGLSRTLGRSVSETLGRMRGTSHGHTTGVSETIHKRALVTPDEIGRQFAGIGDPREDGYPGLALVLISGERSIVLRRVNYFEDPEFARLFEPHPDFPSLARWKDLRVDCAPLAVYDEYLASGGIPASELTGWTVKAHQLVSAGRPAVGLQYGPAALSVRAPFAGMIVTIPQTDQTSWLFTLRYRAKGEEPVDPFQDLAAFAREFTARIKAKFAKARRAVWIAAVIAALFVIAFALMRELWWLAPAGLAALCAAWKAAQTRKWGNILRRRPKALLEDGRIDIDWKIADEPRFHNEPVAVVPPASPEAAAAPTPDIRGMARGAVRAWQAVAQRHKRAFWFGASAGGAALVLVTIGIARKPDTGGVPAVAYVDRRMERTPAVRQAPPPVSKAGATLSASVAPVIHVPAVTKESARPRSAAPDESRPVPDAAPVPPAATSVPPESVPARTAASPVAAPPATPVSGPPASAPAGDFQSAASAPAQTSAAVERPVPAPKYVGPSSGKLVYDGPPVPQNGEIVFRDLPPGPLSLVFDRKKWGAQLLPGENGTQRLVLRSIKPGMQHKAVVSWSVAN